MQIDRKSQSPYAMDHPSAAEHGHCLYMFLEDVRLHLIPMSLNALDDKRFLVEPSDELLVQTVSTLFADPSRNLYNMQDNRQRKLSESLSTFIAEVGRELAHKGISYWEIGNVSDGGPDTVNRSMLFWIAGEVTERLNEVRQRYWQKSEGKRTRHDVILPTSSVQVFRLPRPFGNLRAHRRRMGVLQKASKILPSFVEDGLPRLEHDPVFNHSEYSRAQFSALAKSMRDWGWIGRFWDNKFTTEYYWFWSKIKFHWSLAMLRESIVHDMNALLGRLEIGCEIKMQGPKTAAEINIILEHFKSGSISFGDAFEQASS
ncbi:MAG: hypothetical protein OXQ99_18080 [Chloroflexota bacterium]|nr:hypothetical protein [Chloroflexota bacterium]